jgi:hypothetical protein
MKVGTGTVVPVGDRWVGAFREPGSIKFRVFSVNQQRNAVNRSYDVRLMVIPAGTLPAARGGRALGAHQRADVRQHGR